MNFQDYVSVIRERWLLVLLGTVLGLGLGSAAAFLSTPEYQASTTFFISTPDQSRDANQALQGSLLSEQKIKSYIDLASSRRIREEVSRRVGFPVAPGAISASAQSGTVLLTLSVQDDSPKRAQTLVDAAAGAFGDLVADLERPTSGQQLVVARQVQAADLPVAPVSPRKKTDMTLGLLLGLLLGMFAAVARHTMDRTVKSSEELGDLVQAPVLAVTQYDPTVRLRPLIVHDQPHSPLAETFRQLRTNLEYVDLDRSNRLIVVTSALPDEGKTVTACNLALALAQAGSRVAIVEADLRRPKAAEYMGVENAVGLTTVLTGQVSLDLALQPWRGGLLDFLGAGALPPNPSEMLASSKMAALLDELRARYNMVIFDATPTLPVADAAVLAAKCDGVVLVARSGRVRTDQVTAAAQTIRRVSAPIFGVVLSMSRASQAGSYEYRYTQNSEYSRSVARRAPDGLRGTAPPPPLGPPAASAVAADPPAVATSVPGPRTYSRAERSVDDILSSLGERRPNDPGRW
jgi:capsular exopolysaccharide synthesis family protein